MELIKYIEQLKEYNVRSKDIFINLINNKNKIDDDFIIKAYDKSDLYLNNTDYFIHFCKKDNIKLAQWIYDTNDNIDINSKNNLAYMWAIKNSNNELIQWIESKTENKIIIKFTNNFHIDIMNEFQKDFVNCNRYDYVQKYASKPVKECLDDIIKILELGVEFITENNKIIRNKENILIALHYKYKNYLIDNYINIDMNSYQHMNIEKYIKYLHYPELEVVLNEYNQVKTKVIKKNPKLKKPILIN